ncbi:tubulin polyglutamylase complex subunit 2 isoform X2 [Mobula hypostoma]|uniref:tubulin polyglutamylase complex subunit 2 isoform X2 n=1 Tax=Mobula hypostoma TaxID=723540 RepID=UPI002FC2A30A
MEDDKVMDTKGLMDRLTLGVTKILESRPGVTEVKYAKKEPAEHHMIVSWEQKNCCALPEDLRNFYLMTDGFLLTWNIKFDRSNVQLGRMVINNISALCRLGTSSFYSLPNAPTLADLESDTDDEGVVSSSAEIWFLDRALYWHFLTDTFTAYYRLMLIYLGLPQWQYAFTKYGVTPQAKQWFNMYKPIVYNTNNVADDDVTFINKLDPNQVFKNKSKLQPTKKKSGVQLAGPQKSQTSLVTNKNVPQVGSTTKKMTP